MIQIRRNVILQDDDEEDYDDEEEDYEAEPIQYIPCLKQKKSLSAFGRKRVGSLSTGVTVQVSNLDAEVTDDDIEVICLAFDLR